MFVYNKKNNRQICFENGPISIIVKMFNIGADNGTKPPTEDTWHILYLQIIFFI